MKEPTKKQKIGRLGEDIAVKYLGKKGFSIIERNYLKKCGEIDIIAKKGKILHFVEVKSVTRENTANNADFLGSNWRDHRVSVSRETSGYRAEDNLHPNKLRRLKMTIQLYLLENRSNNEIIWLFDAIIVEIDVDKKIANVKFLEKLIL